jgi:hypothetical protein
MPTRARLPWNTIQREIERAVRQGFPNQRFIKAKHLAEYLCDRSDTYPHFAVPMKSAKTHITLALKKDKEKSGWKQWNEGCNNTTGPVWVVPWVGT